MCYQYLVNKALCVYCCCLSDYKIH